MIKLIGALAFAVFVFFAIGLSTGKAPAVKIFQRKAKKPQTSNKQIWLRQAGLNLTPLQYYAGVFGTSAATFIVISALTSTPIVALAPMAGAAILPHAYFSRKRQKNLSKTKQAWPDAIREIIASIESNASLQGAITQLAYKGPPTLRTAFERFPTLSSTVGVVAALEAVRERLADPTSDRVIEILILAHERGGGVVTEILRDLAVATTEDLILIEEIESSQLEQKINSRAVFVLPWIVLVVLVMTNDQYKEFYNSSAGLLVVIGGAILSFIGILLMAFLQKNIPEPRVFGGSAISNETIDIQDELDTEEKILNN